MRLLVTGGAGFIGSHIVEQALSSGHEVGVLDNLSTGNKANIPPQAGFFEVDLRDRQATAKVLAEFKPTVVSHQAAQASVAVSVRDPALDAEVNILGAIHLLDACVSSQVTNLVFASTGGAIYGEVAAPAKAQETTLPLPKSPYAISKLTVENLLGFYRAERGLNYHILRYANVYGSRQDAFGEAGVVAIFSERVLSGRAIQVNARREPGDDGCVRDYTYVGDVARANLLAATGKLKHEVMNVGTGVECTTLGLAQLIQEAAKRTVEVERGPHRAGDLERSVLDASLCRQVLGSLISLEEGLEKTLEWYQSQPR
jgi:UDP-glucose 4-epimerase